MFSIPKLLKAIANPPVALGILKSMVKGNYWRLRCRLLTPGVNIGTGFQVTHKFVPRGPGHIVIGNNVEMHGGAHPVTLFTHAPDAELLIGNNVFLSGTRFGCALLIDVADDCILSDCRIMDSDFHSIWPDRHSPDAIVETAPVIIERNVWIATGVIILKGVTIGENSVVAAGSVVVKDLPANCLAAGNPARVLKSLVRDE